MAHVGFLALLGGCVIATVGMKPLWVSLSSAPLKQLRPEFEQGCCPNPIFLATVVVHFQGISGYQREKTQIICHSFRKERSGEYLDTSRLYRKTSYRPLKDCHHDHIPVTHCSILAVNVSLLYTVLNMVATCQALVWWSRYMLSLLCQYTDAWAVYLPKLILPYKEMSFQERWTPKNSEWKWNIMAQFKISHLYLQAILWNSRTATRNGQLLFSEVFLFKGTIESVCNGTRLDKVVLFKYFKCKYYILATFSYC